MLNQREITTIDKTDVAKLKWPNEAIYSDVESMNTILIKLKVALIVGNTEKIKCKIFFKDELNIKMVETTIWAVCEKNILLKSGIFIPIRRIIDIKI